VSQNFLGSSRCSQWCVSRLSGPLAMICETETHRSYGLHVCVHVCVLVDINTEASIPFSLSRYIFWGLFELAVPCLVGLTWLFLPNHPSGHAV